MANQISQEDFTRIDTLHYKLENALINLIQSLQKKIPASWNNSFVNINKKQKELDYYKLLDDASQSQSSNHPNIQSK
jgi:hypothetical protein